MQKATENTLVTLFKFLAFNNALLIRKSILRGGGLERARSSASKRPVTSEIDPTYIVLFPKILHGMTRQSAFDSNSSPLK